MASAIKPSELLATFRARLREAGVTIQRTPPEVSLRTMLAFYENERIEGCDPAQGADTLLFHWGTFDWGNGGEFELGLTRQVRRPDQTADQAIWQLHLTYRFIPTEALVSLGEGDRSSGSPSEVPELRRFMESTKAYATVAQAKPQGVTVDYEPLVEEELDVSA